MAATKTLPINFSIDGKSYSLIYDPQSTVDGEGGNGRVLLTDDKLYAVKVLKRINNYERYKRFVREINAAKTIDGVVPGAVIPILHSHIASFDDQKGKKDVSYYVMPKCQEGSKMPKDLKYDEYIKFLLDVSESLLKIHECGYAHRDVKKSNVLKYKGKWLLADLGCSYTHTVERITGKTERIGPKGCPEELCRYDDSDQKPDTLKLYQSSDAFLFAKMIWQTLVGGESFDGSFVHGDYNYRRYIKKANELYSNRLFLPLVEIMERTILYEALKWEKRMTMKEIRDKLEWLQNYSGENDDLLLRQKMLVFAALKEPSCLSYQDPACFSDFFANLPKGTRIDIDPAFVQEGSILFDPSSFFKVDEALGVFRITIQMGRAQIIFKLEEIKIYDNGHGAELLTGSFPPSSDFSAAEKIGQSITINAKTVLRIRLIE